MTDLGNIKIKKIIRLIEFAWLIVASIACFEIISNWENNRNKSYLFGIISSCIGYNMIYIE